MFKKIYIFVYLVLTSVPRFILSYFDGKTITVDKFQEEFKHQYIGFPMIVWKKDPSTIKVRKFEW